MRVRTSHRSSPPRWGWLGLLLVTIGLAGCPDQAPTPSTAREPASMSGQSRSNEQPANRQTGESAESRAARSARRPPPDGHYLHFGVNPTIDTAEENVSTFGLDVDTASYTIARAAIERDELPDPATVRVEEFINYFDYSYPAPHKGDFSLHAEVVPSARAGYHMLSLALKARDVRPTDRPPANIAFVIDVSGSMGRQGRLELVQDALALLVEQLRDQDRIAIVVYGTDARELLPLTPGNQRGRILSAIGALHPEGTTNVQDGLHLAYAILGERPERPGLYRVVLCSDGVGNTDAETTRAVLLDAVQGANRGITLSTVGVRMGNYNDVLMEDLAARGRGVHAYVDRIQEAKRVLAHNLTGAPQVVARDAKLQVIFDETAVARYRLLGYENRNVTRDNLEAPSGGEIGAGHAVTAIYEIQLRSQIASELALVRLRYADPESQRSQRVERKVSSALVRATRSDATGATQLSLAAAAFAEKLRGSYWTRDTSWADISAAYSAIPEELRLQPHGIELGVLIGKAGKLDANRDRSDAALVRTDFDRFAVLK